MNFKKIWQYRKEPKLEDNTMRKDDTVNKDNLKDNKT